MEVRLTSTPGQSKDSPGVSLSGENVAPASIKRVAFKVGSPLCEEWTKFLERYEWQWFGTFTFRDEVHPEAAAKAFRFWVAMIDASKLGPNYQRPSKFLFRVRWVRALEWQKRRVLHYHALINNLGLYDSSRQVRDFWSEEWNKLAGFASLRPISDIGGVTGYVAKYVSKGGEIDLSPTLRPGQWSVLAT